MLQQESDRSVLTGAGCRSKRCIEGGTQIDIRTVLQQEVDDSVMSPTGSPNQRGFEVRSMKTVQSALPNEERYHLPMARRSSGMESVPSQPVDSISLIEVRAEFKKSLSHFDVAQ